MVPKLLFLILSIVLYKSSDATSLELKQVLILSRHNVRYPLGEHLHRFTPKAWPKSDGKPGLLTPRGAILEGYMGEYFSQWFKKEQFLPEGCPKNDTVFAMSNTISRTIATARVFLDALFKNCNVTVHHKDTEEQDPLFNPVIHNTTEASKQKVFQEINNKLKNNPKLAAAFAELNKILDIKKSDVCKTESICDLTNAESKIFYEVGEEVLVFGPLFIGNSALDAFTMSYYNNFPLKDIAWGQIPTPEKWELLTEIGRRDQDIRYRTVAEDIAAPLVNYLTNTFKNFDDKPKLTLIVGHDYNLNSVSTSLGFKMMALPNQNEFIPIGGKIVFQRWTDGNNDYLKVEFVYGSWSQLREGTKFSLAVPPQRVVLTLNWCNTDKNGFCPWNEFVNKL